MVGRVLVVLILLLTFTAVPADADESRYTAFYNRQSTTGWCAG